MDVLHALLKVGADVAHEDGRHEDALFDTVKYRRTKVVRPLLKYGVPSNIKNDRGNTPLLYAVEDGQFELVPLVTPLVIRQI